MPYTLKILVQKEFTRTLFFLIKLSVGPVAHQKITAAREGSEELEEGALDLKEREKKRTQ